ncbi:RNA-binding domain-containing protein, X-linked 2 [Cryptococcus neoformans c45]|nr:RNA-binding domain-containing protein, X-linked 2 [Cryptococcus neoformans var. grubii c45]
MNTIREINRINERELELGVKGSWHDEYKESAYIYVGGLPFELTEGDLITIFSQWGEIMDVNLVRDKETGKSRGFGFLMYEDQRSTVLAVDNMNGTQIIGRTLKVDHTRNYRQQGKRDENGEYEEPEGPTYNAMPPILSGSESSSSEDEQDDLDEEDPMAAFIRAEKKKEAKKIKGNNGDGKKRKHEGETKEERQARKEAKRAKKAEKEEKKKRKEGREGSEKRERRDESERAKSVRSERDEKKGWSKDREDSFWSRGKNAADRDDWRQGKWEMERKKESREKREERPRERDGDVVKDLPENHLDRSTGKGGGGSGRERELEEKPRDRGYRREDDRRRDDGRRKDDKDRDRAYSRRDDGDKDHDWGDHSRRNDRERDMRY